MSVTGKGFMPGEQLPEGWAVTAFRSHDHPDQLWISVSAPGFGSSTKLCTKQNERAIALALMNRPDGVPASDGETFSRADADGGERARG